MMQGGGGALSRSCVLTLEEGSKLGEAALLRGSLGRVEAARNDVGAGDSTETDAGNHDVVVLGLGLARCQ